MCPFYLATCKYFENHGRYKKMFETDVHYREEHIIPIFILPCNGLKNRNPRLYLKWELYFFIPYSCIQCTYTLIFYGLYVN